MENNLLGLPTFGLFNKQSTSAVEMNVSVQSSNLTDAKEMLMQRARTVLGEDMQISLQKITVDETDDSNIFKFSASVSATPIPPEPPKPVPQNPMGEIKKLAEESEDQDPSIPEVFAQNADLAAAFKNFKKKEDNG